MGTTDNMNALCRHVERSADSAIISVMAKRTIIQMTIPIGSMFERHQLCRIVSQRIRHAGHITGCSKRSWINKTLKKDIYYVHEYKIHQYTPLVNDSV